MIDNIVVFFPYTILAMFYKLINQVYTFISLYATYKLIHQSWWLTSWLYLYLLSMLLIFVIYDVHDGNLQLNRNPNRSIYDKFGKSIWIIVHESCILNYKEMIKYFSVAMNSDVEQSSIFDNLKKHTYSTYLTILPQSTKSII